MCLLLGSLPRQKLCIKFDYFSDIISQAANLSVCESICAFCSRMKRGRMYACARREGYNVLAIGQHLDDIAERFVNCLYMLLYTKNILVFASRLCQNFLRF